MQNVKPVVLIVQVLCSIS